MRRTVALTVSTISLLLSGCGGAASQAPATTAPGAPAASSVDPNAPEVNAAGDIPDNQVYVPYQDDAATFTVTVPEGWAQTRSGDAVTFTDKLNSVVIEVLPAAAPPTVDSVTATDLAQIQRSGANVTGGTAESVSRTAGTAILLSYQADAAPDPVTGKVVNDDVERYAFWQSGTEVILTLSGPHGADNVDPWRTVTDSFAWSA